MPETKAVDNAPIESVGGPVDRGPWPSDIEEISTGAAYQRPVQFSDGTTQEVEVTVSNIQHIVRDDGTPTDGYAVSYQFDDPTLGP